MAPEADSAVAVVPAVDSGKTVSGRILMETGIAIPLETEYASRVYVLTAE